MFSIFPESQAGTTRHRGGTRVQPGVVSGQLSLPTSTEAAHSMGSVLVLCIGQEHKPHRNEPYEVGWSTEHPPALQLTSLL